MKFSMYKGSSLVEQLFSFWYWKLGGPVKKNHPLSKSCMQNYIFWKHPKSAEIFIVILNASTLKWSRSVLRFMRISSVSQDIFILSYTIHLLRLMYVREDPFSRADKKWGRATEDKRQLTRTGLLFLPDYIIVHYCPGLHYHPSGSISKKQTQANA